MLLIEGWNKRKSYKGKRKLRDTIVENKTRTGTTSTTTEQISSRDEKQWKCNYAKWNG